MFGIWNTIEKPDQNDRYRTSAVLDGPGLIWLRKGQNGVGFGFECPHVDLSGIKGSFEKLLIEHVKAGESFSFLSITCDESQYFSVFEKTCFDFIEACKQIKESEKRLQIVVNRAVALNRLFARKRRGLTREQIIGLFCELRFLRDIWLLGDNPLSGWKGPLKAPQDFEGVRSVVEVKHLDSKGQVKINSLEQLESDKRLFLIAIRLAENSPGGTSLNGVVHEIREGLGPMEVALFDDLLIHYGFEPDTTYDDIFEVDDLSIFEIKDDFPRLTTSTNLAIKKARYDLDLSACSDYRTNQASLEGEDGRI